MDEKLKVKILFEISQIEKLLDSHKPLLDLCKLKVPDLIEMSAAAMFLHSFYNGIENILRLIVKYYDGELPNDAKWHMEEYLKFRHFVRHSYGFQLEWERMEDLIKNIHDTWKMIIEDLDNFFQIN